MPKSKISEIDRNVLVQLSNDGKFDEMKALAKRLDVSPYYGSVLAARKRNPYQRSRRNYKWSRAQNNGPIIA